MLNQVVLVGRLTKEVDLVVTKDGTKITEFTIAVPRNMKNPDGVYETDFIKITTFNAIAENVANYCKKGTLIGIRGRLQVYENKIQVIAERISFLSSKSTKDESE